jgi:hypothetical protein
VAAAFAVGYRWNKDYASNSVRLAKLNQDHEK